MASTDLVPADERCSTCNHHGDVHYAAGGCSVSGCACKRFGTWGTPPPKAR